MARARFDDFDSAVDLAGRLLPVAAPLVGAMLAAGRGPAAVPAEVDLALSDVVDRLATDVVASRVGLAGRVWRPDWVQKYPSY